MYQSPDFKHFTLAHKTKRRIRIIAPCLRKDQERAYVLEIVLCKRQGIEAVKAVPSIASVTIHFDPEHLPVVNLLQLLETIIANIGQKPRDTITAIKHKNTHPSGVLQDFVIGIGGMSCASCALFLEMMLQREPNITKATVNYVTETARVEGYLAKEALFKLVSANGYQGFAIDTLTERKLVFELESQHLIKARNQLITLGLLSLPVTLLSLLRSKSRPLLLLQALFATPVVFWEGRDIFKKALNQAKHGSANMDSLIALGVGAAYSYSLSALFRSSRHVYFNAATGIIDFVLLGRYLEELAKRKVVNDIRKLVNLQPPEATLLRNNEEIKIGADKITVDDILLIRPGEKIPTDGVVIKGLSSVDESTVTGSSTPSIKESGQKVYDGCINGSGVLHVRATATGKDTVLSGLIHMVDQAQASKLQIQKTVDAFSSVFVPSVIVLSSLTFGGRLLAGERIAHALANAIAVLLISCPCALGLATPAATMVGTGQAARRGIYIRNGEALETAATIDIVIFDKTGTLTEGKADVTDFLNISPLEDESIIQLAASAEFNSEHFLGQALVQYAKERDISWLESAHFHSIPDQGIRAKVGQYELLLGNESWLQGQQIDLTALKATAKKLAKQGKTLIYLAIDHHAAALFAVSDQVRSNAGLVIKQLHESHIETMMVTGDTEEVAWPIADQVGIKTVIAHANPAKKLEIIRSLQKQGRQVAMIGDGINDAPALAAANLSLAIDKGTGIAIHAADLILVKGDIGKVSEAITISHQTLRVIKQNLFWAFGYNAVAIPLAVVGKLNPTIASAAMAFSSVSVIINSLRLSRSSGTYKKTISKNADKNN
jgi:P-type Cu+ transporter